MKTPAGTRDRILAAAAAEFAARGFAATSVDRIARRARANKAMIYYHFPSKRALYTGIVRARYTALHERLAAVAARPIPLDEKLDVLIETLVEQMDGTTDFLPIFLREIADRGAHLGPEELALIGEIFATVSGVIVEGGRQGIFRPVHPGLAHFTLIAPLLFFRATEPIRTRLKSVRKVEMPEVTSAMLAAHLQMVARGMLEMPAVAKRKSR